MTARAFGLGAERVARGLPAALSDVVVADITGGSDGLLEVYRRRLLGKPVRALAVLDDEATAMARRVSFEICRGTPDAAMRGRSLAAFQAGRLRIQGRTPQELFPEAASPRLALLNFLWIAGHIVVRSVHEQRRMFGVCGHRALPITRVSLEDPRVPRVLREGRGDAVVVWAPDLIMAELGPLGVALERLRLPVVVISRDGSAAPFALPAVDVSQAAAALARARVVIDTAADAPDSAHALARLGVPLLVPASLAAEPTLAGAISYDPDHAVVIEAMVRLALGSPPARFHPMPALVAPDTAAALPVEVNCAGGGDVRVSFIVPTCDRPDLLARALRSIERQRGPAVEALVINDGRLDVTDVVARFPRARLLDSPHPGRGPSAVRNVGLEAARGEFIGFLDDDDWLLPDHAEQLVGALERGGADMVHGDVLVCYVRQTDDGRRRVEGLEVYPTVQELARMQFMNLLVLPCLLFRRRLLAHARFDEEMLVCEDYDLWLRLLRTTTPCYHSVPTAVFTWWQTGTNHSQARGSLFADGYARVYARNATADPIIASQRDAFLAALRASGRPTPPTPVLGTWLAAVDVTWLDRLLTEEGIEDSESDG